jgi:Na+-transporting methylmalonyl-CoA/oxaloacetate decarboxylase gamma subunit
MPTRQAVQQTQFRPAYEHPPTNTRPAAYQPPTPYAQPEPTRGRAGVIVLGIVLAILVVLLAALIASAVKRHRYQEACTHHRAPCTTAAAPSLERVTPVTARALRSTPVPAGSHGAAKVGPSSVHEADVN